MTDLIFAVGLIAGLIWSAVFVFLTFFVKNEALAGFGRLVQPASYAGALFLLLFSVEMFRQLAAVGYYAIILVVQVVCAAKILCGVRRIFKV